ncbi:SNase-domain-containing protein [Lanmaoa asiatica]|nr:SNase-domain-containing protein [Lanmaoa asiatica]
MPSSWFPRKDADNTGTSTPPKTSHSHNTPTALDTRPVTSSGSLWTRVQTRSTETPATAHVLAFTLGAASGAGALLAWRRWVMRLRTSEWVTPNEFARRRWVRGVVTSVGDADDFRLYHTPGFGWRWPLKMRRVPTRRKGGICLYPIPRGGYLYQWMIPVIDLKDQTIHVRIAGVDAPEGAHYGRPGQPYAEESLAWLRKRIQGKTLYCQFIRKDQYGRVVGIPLVPRPFLPLFLSKYFGSSLALEMLRAGTATTYEDSGAEYGPWGREKFLRVEEEARAARRGMWKNGVGIELPGEYKKRYSVALGASASKEDVSEGGRGSNEEKIKRAGCYRSCRRC